jgi:sulfur carrier protein ThiS
MKVTVKLHGTLCRRFPGYDQAQGIRVEIQEEGRIKDLLAILEIPEAMRPVVVLEGRVLKTDDRVPFGSCVAVFEPIHGG